jgi:hypothetical protein
MMRQPRAIVGMAASNASLQKLNLMLSCKKADSHL